MNKIHLIGNLTKDPETRISSKGIPVCKFTIAVNRPRVGTDGQGVDFVKIVTFRQLAENCEKYISKGKKVGITGALRISKYQNENGENRTNTEVYADDVHFLSSSRDNNKTQESYDEWKPIITDPSDVPF